MRFERLSNTEDEVLTEFLARPESARNFGRVACLIDLTSCFLELVYMPLWYMRWASLDT